MGDKKLITQGVVQFIVAAVEHRRVFLYLEHLTHQGEAVGMRAGGGEAEDEIAWADTGAVDEAVLGDDPYGEAREVVLPLGIEARHLGGLAAKQGQAGLGTAFHDPR